MECTTYGKTTVYMCILFNKHEKNFQSNIITRIQEADGHKIRAFYAYLLLSWFLWVCVCVHTQYTHTHTHYLHRKRARLRAQHLSCISQAAEERIYHNWSSNLHPRLGPPSVWLGFLSFFLLLLRLLLLPFVCVCVCVCLAVTDAVTAAVLLLFFPFFSFNCSFCSFRCCMCLYAIAGLRLDVVLLLTAHTTHTTNM